MDLVENTLDVELDAFLAQPLFCFLSTTTPAGAPRVSPLWFLWEAGALWIVGDRWKTYPSRIEANPESAVALVEFDRETGTVRHVGMRGRASVGSLDPARAERLLSKYLGPDSDQWDRSRFPDPREWGEEMVTIRFEPERVVARDQSYRPAPCLE